MQRNKFLFVCGILMIIGAVVTIIVSGIMGLLGGAAAGSGMGDDVEGMGILIIIGAVVAIIGGLVQLIAGILGAKNANKPEKAKGCLIMGIIVVVLALTSVIMNFSVAGLISSLLIPVLYLVGAIQLKNSAA